jgi:hypothetical protein
LIRADSTTVRAPRDTWLTICFKNGWVMPLTKHAFKAAVGYSVLRCMNCWWAVTRNEPKQKSRSLVVSMLLSSNCITNNMAGRYVRVGLPDGSGSPVAYCYLAAVADSGSMVSRLACYYSAKTRLFTSVERFARFSDWITLMCLASLAPVRNVESRSSPCLTSEQITPVGSSIHQLAP